MNAVEYVTRRIREGLSFSEACEEYRAKVENYVKTLKEKVTV